MHQFLWGKGYFFRDEGVHVQITLLTAGIGFWSTFHAAICLPKLDVTQINNVHMNVFIWSSPLKAKAQANFVVYHTYDTLYAI